MLFRVVFIGCLCVAIASAGHHRSSEDRSHSSSKEDSSKSSSKENSKGSSHEDNKDDKRTVTLKPNSNWITVFQSDNYPEIPSADIKRGVILKTDGKCRIKFFCTDFRMHVLPEDNCYFGKMTIKDGKNKMEKCGVIDGVFVKSETDKMEISLTTQNKGSAVFTCIAKSMCKTKKKDMEEIELRPGSEPVVINFPAKEGVEEVRSWNIKTKKSKEGINVKCDMIFLQPLDHSGECARDVLTIEDGKDSTEYCGFKEVEFVSKSDEINIAAELYPGSEGRLTCKISLGDDKK